MNYFIEIKHILYNHYLIIQNEICPVFINVICTEHKYKLMIF